MTSPVQTMDEITMEEQYTDWYMTSTAQTMDNITTDERYTDWFMTSAGQSEEVSDEEKWTETYRGRNMMIGLVGTLLNVLTLMAVVRHKELSFFLRCALVSLVTTDLGLSAAVFVASLNSGTPEKITLLIVHLIYIFIDCTALNLLVIALDRACAMYYPLWYKSFNERYVKVVLLVPSPWALAVCFAVPSFRRDVRGFPRYPLGLMTESGWLVQGVLLLVCGVGVLVSYLAIGVGMKLRARRVVVYPSFLTTAAMGHVTPAESQRSRRVTIHTAFLAAWFCVIYITFSFYFLTAYVTRVNVLTEFNSSRNIIMSTFILINSLVNPFLFFWRLVTFSSVLAFIRRLLPRRNHARWSIWQNRTTPHLGMAADSRRVGEPRLPACHVPSSASKRGGAVAKDSRLEIAPISTISC